MLGIHRNNLCTIAFGLRHHQFPGADQGFLVGKTDAFFCPDGSQGGPESHHTHHSGNHAVRLGNLGRFNQSGFSPAYPNGKVCDFPGQGLGRFFRCHDSQLRLKLPALLGHALDTCSRRQGHYLNFRQMGDNIQALPANGAGRAKNADIVYHSLFLITQLPPESTAKMLPSGAPPSPANPAGPEHRRVRESGCHSP